MEERSAEMIMGRGGGIGGSAGAVGIGDAQGAVGMVDKARGGGIEERCEGCGVLGGCAGRRLGSWSVRGRWLGA